MVFAKVVETNKADKAVFHERRDFGSTVYEQRILSQGHWIVLGEERPLR